MRNFIDTYFFPCAMFYIIAQTVALLSMSLFLLK